MTLDLVATQGIIKQAVDESVEKIHAWITAEIIDQILRKEIKAKEKVATAKDTLEKFMAHWKKD